MTSADNLPANHGRVRRWPAHRWGLLLVVAALACLRLPTVWYRMGGQDEQWYSVPGWTVAWEGVPRIPYVPTRHDLPAADRVSVFDGADQLLFALPPAYFYVQAPLFWIFPPGYGTARLAAWCSGWAALLATYGLMRQLHVRCWTAICVLPVCGLGRAFTFPWQDSRPDMLCAAFGLAAMAGLLVAIQQQRLRWFAFSGLCIGLAGLTHPYAVVFALQLAVVVLVSGQTLTAKLRQCAVAGLCAAAGTALWLPLIAMDADLFWSQFSRNVLSRSGPGLISRLAWPWDFVEFQCQLIGERLGTLQSCLLLAIFSAALLWALRFVWENLRLGWRRMPSKLIALDAAHESSPRLWIGLLLAGSAMYLHVASLGMHPAKGYLCYPWACVVCLLAVICDAGLRRCGSRERQFWCGGLVCVLVWVLCVPGSGLRATLTYATRNHETNYNRRAFCEQLSQRLPPGARLIVSPEYVFEFELLGYKPINASRIALYHDVQGLPYDYLIASTQAFDEDIPAALHGRLVWELGDPDDPLACYAAVYASSDQTLVNRKWPR